MKYNVIASLFLANKVLVVVTRRGEGTWCAYIKDVPGENYEREAQLVAEWGSKLLESRARCLFPYIEGPYGK